MNVRMPRLPRQDHAIFSWTVCPRVLASYLTAARVGAHGICSTRKKKFHKVLTEERFGVLVLYTLVRHLK